MKGIGTKGESGLHRALKFRYAGEGGQTEIPLKGYVCDGLNEAGEYIEVQTGSFKPLREKVKKLTEAGPVRIIHPIMVTKHLELFDEGGTLLSRRKSPRKGTPWDLFKALVYAPDLPEIPGVTIELALVEVSEQRVRDGRGSWRRRGISITGRELLIHHGSIPLSSPGDYRCFVPFQRDETFTVRSLGDKAGIHPALAGKTLYVLTRLSVTTRIEKKGHAWVYRLTGTSALVRRRPGKEFSPSTEL
ncbi:MAG: hypothetical protein LBB78_11065 [Spirochaetaceae bacterium]|jgi:hypothetical protein|nr:hypothetical protein [Spirochaetaceae bacterium]